MLLVTGGAGFMGSNLVARLQEEGINDVVVCDYLGSSDKWKNLAKHEIRDLVCPKDLWSFLERYEGKIEAIFHLGAASSTTEYDTDLVLDTNFVLTRNLWKWAANHNARFIYSSAAATYGDGAQGFKDEDTPEAMAKLRPLNPYGWSKHLFDRRVARIAADQGKPNAEQMPPQWAGLKFFDVYGPNEYHKDEQKSVVCKRYPEVALGASAKLYKSYHPDYADGGQMRDFVYVKDCVDVMMWFYNNPDKNGIYNVGTGKARSFEDLTNALFDVCGKEPKIQYVDMPETLKDKYQYFTEANVDRLRAAGYDKPFTTLEGGIRDYVQNHLSKDDPYI